MRRRSFSLVMTGGAIVLGACGGGEVIVQAQVEGEGGEPTPIAAVEVMALPYDRDEIFDSLKAAFPTPEPTIPDSILRLQSEIASAQAEWQQAEAAWNAARDSLNVLNQAMQRLSRGSAQYRLLFADFGDQESRERSAGQRSRQAFQRYDALQKRVASQAAQLRVQRELWANEAYAPVDSIIELRLEELGREELVDTTDASGIVRFPSVKTGQWWVHARYDLPFEELYWNVPVEVRRGDPIQVILNRANAQVRPKL